MNDKLIEKGLSLVDKAVAKIGAGAEHGYTLYVKQQIIEGSVYSIASLIILILCIVVMYKCGKEWYKLNQKHYRDRSTAEDNNLFMFGAFIVVAVIIGVICIPVLINSVIQLANPEYAAIQSIIKQIK